MFKYTYLHIIMCPFSEGRPGKWQQVCKEWMELMSYRIPRETKQQPSMSPGPAVPGCCLVSFPFLCDIHSIHSVETNLRRRGRRVVLSHQKTVTHGVTTVSPRWRGDHLSGLGVQHHLRRCAAARRGGVLVAVPTRPGPRPEPAKMPRV